MDGVQIDDGVYKARLIAIGSRMPSKEVLEIETAAPAPKLSTVRLLLALAAKFDLPAHLADIKTAFLTAKAQNPVYMHLPSGFRDLNLDSRGKPKLALLLKSIYGTANAPFLFYNLLRTSEISYSHWDLGHHRTIRVCILWSAMANEYGCCTGSMICAW